MKKFRIVLKIVIGTILLALVTVLMLGEIPVCVVGESEHKDYSNFMSDCNANNPNFVNVPITEIAMLGSHDACTSDICLTSMSNTSENNLTNNGFLAAIGKGLMVRLSRAQRDNVYEQLKAGSRYLDMRITNIGENFYTSHGLVSNTLEYSLRLILQFLDENPGEVVIFEAKKFYQDKKNSTDLVEYMSSIKYNEKCLFDYINYPSNITKFKDLTYGLLTDNGTKAGVVVFSDEIYAAPFDQLSYSYYYSKHHDEMDTNLIIEGIRNSKIECEELGNDYLRINQVQTTPHEEKIWASFASWSLLAKAETHNKIIIELPDIVDIAKNIPIFMVDYCTNNTNGFNDSYISLAKSINYSL